MARKSKSIPYPAKLAKDLNQRLYRLERKGVTDLSPFYMQAEQFSLQERFYQFSMKGGKPTVRVFNRTQWSKLTPAEQRKILKLYEGGMQAKTSTITGIKSSEREWLETYKRHNPKLFKDETQAKTEKERARIMLENERKAQQHRDFFANFWAQMKDHFQYDQQTWQKMMKNFDIQAMVDSGMSPSRLREIYNMVKNPQSKHKVPKKYWGTRNRWRSRKEYYGE